jgi:predicted dehydrogenase/threonine dehydrogenase-like Zn-dependent dehydrogenase
MKQILQNLRTGQLNVEDVPEPEMAGPGALIATQTSVISAGTEKMLIDFANKGLIAKAKARPNDVKQVLDKIKRSGIRATLKTVFARLDQPMKLGYSSAGIVLATSPEITDIKPGDRVACGGTEHAEVVFAKKNLIVPMPENVDFESACFATLGSIAMQGVRVAELVIGQRIAVIGLGLLGLITVQLVKAAGCRAIGADINPERLKLAEQLGCDKACHPNQLPEVVGDMTQNRGADAVIITAATKSNEPTELAAQIARQKGIISVVGAVRMDIPRKPFYAKELQLRLSTSYGPGRYDVSYEDKGIDYPFGYVPWTEQRNMACVLDLISQGKLNIKPLITHRFPIEQGQQAYAMLSGETKEPYLGIVLTYPKPEHREIKPIIKSSEKVFITAKNKVGIGVIGAGNFASLTMLPAMKNITDIEFVGIADVNSSMAKHAQNKFGFQYSAGDYRKLLQDDNISTIFVTTRHDVHASLAIEALQAGKNVMVEKPLCLNQQQLMNIINVVEQHPHQRLTVGFNRRFAPMAVELKNRLKGKNPLCMNYICNAGFTPKDSWTRDPQIGGGRIIGEACHFIDWMCWLTDSEPTKVYAQSISKETANVFKEDNVMISLHFADGSIGTVSYLACGDKSFAKEHIEVYSGGAIGVINDFTKGIFVAGGSTNKLAGNSKGHLQQWQAFISAIKDGRPAPVEFGDVVASTWATLKAIESLHTAELIELI